MQPPDQDLEEVVLFPDLAPGAEDGAPGPVAEASAAAMREWLTVQLAQIEGQLRNQKQIPKPPGYSPEVAAYLQAREVQIGRKVSREAYTKALQKLDHFLKA